jgi:hypothetical protein
VCTRFTIEGIYSGDIVVCLNMSLGILMYQQRCRTNDPLADDPIPGLGSRYSDWLRKGRQWGRSLSPGRVKNVLFSIASRLALRPTQPPIQWVPEALTPG